MSSIDLRYGRGTVPFSFDASRFDVLDNARDSPPMSDAELGLAFDAPIDSPPLEDIVGQGERVLLVVPDATRQVGAGQVVNIVVRRLIANGTVPSDICVIFATGIHRKVTDAEKQAILTPFIAQRITTIDHQADDVLRNFRIGELGGGIPVELNWTLTEFDHVVPVGGVVFHYFAGFTGGRKLICPGLASTKTISDTHKLAFDCERKVRRAGVGPGLLDGNAVHEAFEAAAAMINPAFGVNSIVNDEGHITALFCGQWIASHRAACESYAALHSLSLDEKRDLVIASCGGYPFDINMIQAHKALDAASAACKPGGTIVLMAECSDGLGNENFLDWFDANNSDALAVKLSERYQVNGQTAWSLLRKTEGFDVRLMSKLDTKTVAKMRMKKTDDLDVLSNEKGYILASGAKILIKTG